MVMGIMAFLFYHITQPLSSTSLLSTFFLFCYKGPLFLDFFFSFSSPPPSPNCLPLWYILLQQCTLRPVPASFPLSTNTVDKQVVIKRQITPCGPRIPEDCPTVIIKLSRSHPRRSFRLPRTGIQ
ncbi:hypothetical protein BGZ63DRAFT_129419 [Mariannaea sp. PMI_226]|nr:hypothetical protein BGZ63DRAFT_129419 [Mariannaea sp. PMI_226]